MSDHAEVPTDHPVLLFDGVCNLCNGLVQWIIERDPEAEFRFAALQSEAGQALLDRNDLPTADFDTVVLVEGGEYYTKSMAALRVLKRLGLPYSLAYPAVLVPRFVRDCVYDIVAEHRYGWFGRRESCMRPTPELEARFLDGASPARGNH
ncbi:thiol-disulfide oxidoreductase DCC family protein [Natronomonas marina]|uniref:thiol-disulfide oxidoreductase DCC family protein n=1 Tax=Natronomonas marina TaxID=2961939 RepID=UPI0020C95248|nr:thiol-disulfide oxidoreductase DCC family protein [Natronomonas marina]